MNKPNETEFKPVNCGIFARIAFGLMLCLSLGACHDEHHGPIGDVDLVQRAIDVLDDRLADAYTVAAEDGELTEGVMAALADVYAPDQLGPMSEVFDGQWQPFFVDDPGAPVSEVLELRTTSPGCINAVVARDMSAVFGDDDYSADRWSISLVPDAPSDDELVWRMAQETVDVDDVPEDDCPELEVSP
jgi:hypothetical protein